MITDLTRQVSIDPGLFDKSNAAKQQQRVIKNSSYRRTFLKIDNICIHSTGGGFFFLFIFIATNRNIFFMNKLLLNNLRCAGRGTWCSNYKAPLNI
jgi:hypothetical protein